MTLHHGTRCTGGKLEVSKLEKEVTLTRPEKVFTCRPEAGLLCPVDLLAPRTWCRFEVLSRRQHGRHIIIIM